MYQRAMRYGLRGLSLAYPGFAEAVRLDPAGAMSDTVPEDVPFLYWTAAAWGAAIGLGTDDPALLADLPVVEAMLRRALSLDETYLAGAIHVALIRVEIAQRGTGGRHQPAVVNAQTDITAGAESKAAVE